MYERHGVREYWIVSPLSREIEQYILKDGRLTFFDSYHHYSPNELAYMKERDRVNIVGEFKCSLFEDLIIRLEDVFSRVH